MGDRATIGANGTAAAAFLLVGCAAAPSLPSDAAIFAQPQAYLGQRVRVCGYSDEPYNLYQADPRSDAMPVGLAVFTGAREPVFRRGPRCITGRIVRTGCTVENICTRHNFEYGIRPR